VPGEVSHHVLGNPAEGPPAEPVFDKLFQEPHQEDDRPVDDGLEQDRFDHGGRVEPAEEGQCIRQQHRLAHHQRSRGCDHKVPQVDQVISKNELGSQYNEVEADREEHCRRQEFLELFDDECEEARLGIDRFLWRLCCKSNGRDFTPQGLTLIYATRY